MLPELITNQIKDAAGVEVEFNRRRIASGSEPTEFRQVGEPPAYKNQMLLSHQESGSGIDKRRRSVIRFNLESASEIDPTITASDSCYIVLDAAIGKHTGTTAQKKVLAQCMSFVASDGSSSTILYGGTGTGAVALLTGDN